MILVEVISTAERRNRAGECTAKGKTGKVYVQEGIKLTKILQLGRYD